MNRTALITGASAGIGYEFTKIFAENGYDLVLVSRNRQRLEAMAGEIETRDRVRVTVLPEDLAEPSAPRKIYKTLASDSIEIEVLVNNAGFGLNGKFTDTDADKHRSLIQLNITALTVLCNLFGSEMAKRGSGKILNVSSMAAFQAGPFMSTYYASKAYVLMFSEALHRELKNDGVTVTTLCPGPTQTEFFERSGSTETRLAKSPHIMKAVDVAQAGFTGLMKNKKIVIPGVMNKTMVFSLRFSPRSLVTAIAGAINRSEGG